MYCSKRLEGFASRRIALGPLTWIIHPINAQRVTCDEVRDSLSRRAGRSDVDEGGMAPRQRAAVELVADQSGGGYLGAAKVIGDDFEVVTEQARRVGASAGGDICVRFGLFYRMSLVTWRVVLRRDS